MTEGPITVSVLIIRGGSILLVEEQGPHRLLPSQFPALPLRNVRLLAEGWDNAVWVVNDFARHRRHRAR